MFDLKEFEVFSKVALVTCFVNFKKGGNLPFFYVNKCLENTVFLICEQAMFMWPFSESQLGILSGRLECVRPKWSFLSNVHGVDVSPTPDLVGFE